MPTLKLFVGTVRLGKFTYLKQNGGAQYGIADGDVVKATVVGNVITAYINGVQVAQATDTRSPMEARGSVSIFRERPV